jgi:hypothetical protein
MKSKFQILGTTTAITFLMLASTGYAATFSELDTNDDDILTEEEFIEVLGPHHGTIAYRQYNTNAEPITVKTEKVVQAVDDAGNSLFEKGEPVMTEDRDAEGNLLQATDDAGNLLFEKGEPIMETVVTETTVEGVTVDEIRRSQRGFERSNAGKARAYSNKQRAAENRTNSRSQSDKGSSGSSSGDRGGRGRNK